MFNKQVSELKNEVSEKKFEIKKLNRERDFEIKVGIEDGAKLKEDEINELKQTNATINKENEMLNTAFKELGLDVKDTKDIISDLVKGLATKNTVSVIK